MKSTLAKVSSFVQGEKLYSIRSFQKYFLVVEQPPAGEATQTAREVHGSSGFVSWVIAILHSRYHNDKDKEKEKDKDNDNEI